MGMATATQSQTSLKVEQNKQENDNENVKILLASCDQHIIDHTLKLIRKYDVKVPNRKFCRMAKDSLDKTFGKEWGVFMGGHYCGAVGVVQNRHFELLINDNLKVIIFQSYQKDKI